MARVPCSACPVCTPTFPSGSFANPTLMAIAHALRLAAHLVVGSAA